MGIERKFTFMHDQRERNFSAIWLIQSRNFPTYVLTYNDGIKRASKKSLEMNGKQEEVPVVLRCSVICVWV